MNKKTYGAVKRTFEVASMLTIGALFCLWIILYVAPATLERIYDYAASEAAESEVSAPGSVNSEGWTEFDAERYPDYYRIIDKPCDVDVELPAGVIQYGEPDALGRTTRVVANVTPDMVEESKGWRAGFASDADDISGWGHNQKVTIPLGNGKTYNGWFWNRSHLLADALGGYGIFGVELFIKGDDVIFSEVSPRPHDTGMVTMISQDLSEFALHARALLGLPVPAIRFFGPSASMAVVVEGDTDKIEMDALEQVLAEPGVQIRIFGKPEIKGHRRMGVILATDETLDAARAKAQRAYDSLKVNVLPR